MIYISVIIPTYNSEQTIKRCFDSLLVQTYKDFELCILDGGSSDETITKVNTFRDNFKNIKIISEPDKGVYDAMNKGIDLAEGEWLYFMGSDDEIFDKDVFLDISNTPASKKHGIIYGNAYVSDDTSWAKAGQVYDGYFDIKKLLTKNICHQAIFYKRELFQRFGKYKLQYPVCGDWEINLRLFPKTEPIYLDRIIAKFYGGGLSSKPENDPIGHDLKKLRQQTLKDYYIRKITSFLRIA